MTIAFALNRVLQEDLNWNPACTGSQVQENTSVGPVATSHPHGPVVNSPAGLPIVTSNEEGTSFQTASNRASYSLSSMMKSYAYESHKYSGSLRDNFEKKLKIFEERCEQCGISESEKPKAFSLMLTGVALEYYFSHVKGVISNFDAMVEKVKQRFLTEERTLTMTQEWESTSLSTYIKENPSLTKKEVARQDDFRLQELQICLPKEYRSDVILKNKLLSACAGIDECRLARQKVASTVEGVIADLHTSISTASTSSSQDTPNDLLTALFTTTRKRVGNFTRSPPTNKTCYVCGKFGCYSSKHSTEEKLAALRKRPKVSERMSLMHYLNKLRKRSLKTKLMH